MLLESEFFDFLHILLDLLESLCVHRFFSPCDHELLIFVSREDHELALVEACLLLQIFLLGFKLLCCVELVEV